MPGYTPIHSVAGNLPPTEIFTPDTTQRWPLGMILDATAPVYGFARFIYGKAGAAMNPGRLVRPSDAVFTMADVANTAGLGSPVFVAREVFAINTFGWFQMAGVAPVQTAASVAAGVAVGIGAAGQAGTNTAGKQILNAQVLAASTYAPTQSCGIKNGNTRIQVQTTDGLFYGLPVSGTGIAASTTITGLDPSGRSIIVNNAATATGQQTLTFTHTGFLLLLLNNSFSGGA